MKKTSIREPLRLSAMYPLLTILLLFLIVSAAAHPGVGIVMDSKKNIFYTDLTHVWKIDASGKKTIAVRNVHTHELYLDENDNLFGEHLWYEGEKIDKWGHYVWQLSPSGRLKKIIPATEGFLTNYSFVHDSHGRMFWANREKPCQQVGRKDTKGEVANLGDQCMTDIRWMASDAEGNVFLTDLGALKKIDTNGHIQTVVKQLHKEPRAAMGVWLDAKRNIYVAVYGDRSVKKVSPDGQVTVAAETSFPWSPSGGMVDSEGNLWILEANIINSVRVERIAFDGKRKVY